MNKNYECIGLRRLLNIASSCPNVDGIPNRASGYYLADVLSLSIIFPVQWNVPKQSHNPKASWKSCSGSCPYRTLEIISRVPLLCTVKCINGWLVISFFFFFNFVLECIQIGRCSRISVDFHFVANLYTNKKKLLDKYLCPRLYMEWPTYKLARLLTSTVCDVPS